MTSPGRTAAPPARLSATLRHPPPPAPCGKQPRSPAQPSRRSPRLRGRAEKRFCLWGRSRSARVGGPVSPRVSVGRSSGGSAAGAACSRGRRGGTGSGASRHSLRAGAGAGSGALGLPAGPEEPSAERWRSGERSARAEDLSRGRPVGEGQHLGQARPVRRRARASCFPAEKGSWTRRAVASAPAEARWRNAGTMRHLSPPGRAAAGSAAQGADLC